METFKNKKNVAILARLGIFHSSINNPKFKFIYPDTKNLMFSPSDWSPEISNIYLDQNRTWGRVFDNKLVVEKIKTPADGSPGVGKRYRRVIELLKSKGLLLEDMEKTPLPDSFRKRYYYKRGNEIYLSAHKFIVRQLENQ